MKRLLLGVVLLALSGCDYDAPASPEEKCTLICGGSIYRFPNGVEVCRVADSIYIPMCPDWREQTRSLYGVPAVEEDSDGTDTPAEAEDGDDT